MRERFERCFGWLRRASGMSRQVTAPCLRSCSSFSLVVGLRVPGRRARVAVWTACRRRDPWRVEQVFDVADARDPAHVALDALDLLGIFELPAQDYDPAVGVDADRSFGNRPVAE